MNELWGRILVNDRLIALIFSRLAYSGWWNFTYVVPKPLKADHLRSHQGNPPDFPLF
jgi:hypothetical protein